MFKNLLARATSQGFTVRLLETATKEMSYCTLVRDGRKGEVSLYIYQRRGHTVRLLEMAVKEKFYCMFVRNGCALVRAGRKREVLLCVCYSWP